MQQEDVDAQLISDFGLLRDETGRRQLLSGHPQARRRELVQKLAAEVVKAQQVDVNRSLALAEAALLVAESLADDVASATAFRAKGAALYGLDQYEAAIEQYEKALRLFEAAKDDIECGRTLSGSIQSMILLGEYARALSVADRARDIFKSKGETHRLGRLELNVGNIFQRQDRFEEAMVRYEEAYRVLAEHQDAEGVAAALSNMAVTLIMMNDSKRAFETHRRARSHCEEHGMPRLVARADYNIAYLHYLVGNYGRAIEMLRAARSEFRESGDEYHQALCDLDQAEMYVELNLSGEAAELASRARARFEKLGTGYEAAKAMVLHAVALNERGEALRALELFEDARDGFIREGNAAWPKVVDLYRALILYEQGRLFESRRLCRDVLPFFDSSDLPGKAVLSRLLMARLSLKLGDLDIARHECEKARECLLTLHAPMLSYQASFVMGEIEETAGRREAARECYETARQELETLRSSLHRDELKIAFMKSKLAVYESLVELCMEQHSRSDVAEETFEHVEHAKSRGLIDLILSPGQSRAGLEYGESDLARRVHGLREEVNWYYRRIELEELRGGHGLPQRMEQLRREALAREKELLDATRELPRWESTSGALHNARPLDLREIRAALDPGTVLLEYYVSRDQLIAFAVTRDRVELVSLGPAEVARDVMQRLQFQLSKPRLDPRYVAAFGEMLLEATHAHLAELYELLIAPLRRSLTGQRLVVIPHDFLHYLPFHALFDGERYLIDDYSVSYAPSASVYAHIRGLAPSQGAMAVIAGVPGAQVPHVREEVASIAAAVPDSIVLLGEDATRGALVEKAARSWLIHIASHGYFRHDNPMFSAIRLGDGYLSLYDLYDLKLPVDLVTLSACATGVSAVAAGDELVGLVRGLLYAGARSLLVTLWDVQDKTTAEFMRSFYSHLRPGGDKGAALRSAILALRRRHPHPYFWAPYVLIG